MAEAGRSQQSPVAMSAQLLRATVVVFLGALALGTIFMLAAMDGVVRSLLLIDTATQAAWLDLGGAEDRKENLKH